MSNEVLRRLVLHFILQISLTLIQALMYRLLRSSKIVVKLLLVTEFKMESIVTLLSTVLEVQLSFCIHEQMRMIFLRRNLFVALLFFICSHFLE